MPWSRLRQCLFLALCFYPAWWLASVSLYSLSAWTSGRPLRIEEVSALGFVPGPPLRDPGPRWLLAAALAAALAYLFRKRPTASGLAVSAVAFAAAFHFVTDGFRLGLPSAIASALACVLAASLGIRSLLTAPTWPLRLLEALLAVGLPLAVICSSTVRSFRFAAYFAAGALLLSLLAALAASIGRPWGQAFQPRASWLLAPLLFTGLILGGTSHRDRLAREQRQAKLDRQHAAVPRVPAPAAYPKLFFQRGISLLGDGREGYFPAPSAHILDRLARYHVNAIALVPYGSSSPDGEPVRFDREHRSWPLYESLGHLARARRIRVLLKPQIWARGFPGNIDIPDPSRRRAWFQSYSEFIEDWARLAVLIHADLFCVGTEFVKLSMHEAEWRAVIARVRAIYPGPLVYAATQGEEFENLRFWDALDYIGLNNYYPLPDGLDTRPLLKKIEAVRAKFPQPFLLTEAGFASVSHPHREPWSEPFREPNLEDQARCYEAILRTFDGQPWFYGAYWWKVATHGGGGPLDRSMTPWGKPAMDVLGRWYERWLSRP